MLDNLSKSLAISAKTIKAIEEHPEELSMVVKLTTIGIKDVQKPLLPKIALSEEQIRCCGDGSTAWGDIKAFFWNLITLWIPYSRLREGHVIDGKTTLDKKREESFDLDKKREESFERSRHLADAGIDDRNGSKRLNKLYKLPVAVVRDFTAIAKKLADKKEYLTFKNSEDETPLYTLQLEKNENDPLQSNKGEQPSPYQIVANSKGLFCKAGTVYISKLMSLQEYNNNVTLRKIRSKLTLEARLAFQPYFDLKTIGTVDDKSPIALGGPVTDMQLIVTALQAGSFELLDKRDIRLLINLINSDAKQSMTEAEEDECDVWYEELVGKLKINNDAPPLIVNGDIVDSRIKQKLKNAGVAHFIAGPNALKDLPEFIEKNPQLKASDLYTNAYYDEETKKLYLPQGLRMDSIQSKHRMHTALGPYSDASRGVLGAPKGQNRLWSNFNPHRFVQLINQQPLPEPEDKENFEICRTFKASGAEIQNAAKVLGVTIVTVRNCAMNPDHTNVITLNRWELQGTSTFVGAAARIGHSIPINENNVNNSESVNSIESENHAEENWSIAESRKPISVSSKESENTSEDNFDTTKINNDVLDQENFSTTKVNDDVPNHENFATTRINNDAPSQESSTTVIIRSGQAGDESNYEAPKVPRQTDVVRIPFSSKTSAQPSKENFETTKFNFETIKINNGVPIQFKLTPIDDESNELQAVKRTVVSSEKSEHLAEENDAVPKNKNDVSPRLVDPTEDITNGSENDSI